MPAKKKTVETEGEGNAESPIEETPPVVNMTTLQYRDPDHPEVIGVEVRIDYGAVSIAIWKEVYSRAETALQQNLLIDGLTQQLYAHHGEQMSKIPRNLFNMNKGRGG